MQRSMTTFSLKDFADIAGFSSMSNLLLNVDVEQAYAASMVAFTLALKITAISNICRKTVDNLIIHVELVY